MAELPRIGVVGATGAVGTVTLGLLRDRGYENVRIFASARSAGRDLRGWTVEEATPEALSRGDVDIFLFSVGTSASRELVPLAVAGGAVAVDKSSAYRLEPGIPLVVPEVNAARALEHDGIVANPNCCTIPLTCVLKPLHDAAGLARVRVATYQSVSGAGAQSMERLRNEAPADHDLRMDWDFDGEEFDEESKLRAETQKIMELPELAIQANCVRVPVMVGHAEAIWIETEDELTPDQARSLLRSAPSVRLDEFPTPGKAAGIDDVLVGRIRRDPTVAHGLALFLASDNLRKGAALNAIQIAELVLRRERAARSRAVRGIAGSSRAAACGQIRFAAENGFAALQIRTDSPGEIARDLRADLGEVGRVFSETGVEPARRTSTWRSSSRISRAVRRAIDGRRRTTLRRSRRRLLELTPREAAASAPERPRARRTHP